jgi:predicted lysophospholipase L1 biosynthesis ABC-type transport system permease subunit
VSTNSDLEAVISGHLDIIARALEVVALVMLAVCALGLASSTSVNVIERTREIGVLKAIGGRAGAIRGIFLWEAVFVALIGWAIATVLAPIPSEIVSTNFGIVMVQYPFNYKAEIWSAPMAAGIALTIAILAAILPAQAAARHSRLSEPVLGNIVIQAAIDVRVIWSFIWVGQRRDARMLATGILPVVDWAKRAAFISPKFSAISKSGEVK